MTDLVDASIRIIRENQSINGAYMASPNFRDYRFSWMRDGSFIAYAMAVKGQTDSAISFLGWGDEVLGRYRHKVDRLAEILAHGGAPTPHDFLPARYTMDGLVVEDSWPCFQPDGYGAWLWCLARVIELTGDRTLLTRMAPTIETALAYLGMVWNLPCYDCWEENADKIHPASIACCAGGVAAINRWLQRPDLDRMYAAMKGFVTSHLTPDGRLPKFIGSLSVDASLLWVSLPFGVLAPEEPVMRKTVAAIEARLLEKGGVKRYPEDTYFGGGQWILLTCWLGWYYAQTGRQASAREMLSWAERRADANAWLAEQDLTITNDPSYITQWESRSGRVARPLLWSHAMYLVLHDACEGFAARSVHDKSR